jgi:hypothetical protein
MGLHSCHVVSEDIPCFGGYSVFRRIFRASEDIPCFGGYSVFRRIFRVSAAYHLFPTTLSPLKISDFSGENLKVFEVLKFSISATTTQLLSSGKFCKLRYETIPVKCASANCVMTLYLLNVHLQTAL